MPGSSVYVSYHQLKQKEPKIKHGTSNFKRQSLYCCFASLSCPPTTFSGIAAAPESDVDLLEFLLNLEYLEAEFFLFGSLGYGLDVVAPNLTEGGPPPIGARLARLDSLVRDIILQFGFQEVGHLRAIKSTVRGFPRPLLDLSTASFAKVMNSAFGRPLVPPFDPYANSINYLLASYVIPYVGLTGYVGANPLLQNATSKRLVAGLLGVESGQDAVIRTLLYEYRTLSVQPYNVTVAEFTNRISMLRNNLGGSGLKDEGLVVPREQGAEGRVTGNILVGDKDSLSYPRTPREILRIIYGGGDEHVPGSFYPKGASVLPLILLDYSSSVLFASAKSPESKDADLLEFALNLEYLEAEFFLFGALGHGLDVVAPNLTGGGPLPIGAKKVELDDLTNDVILQFAFQEVGHLRAIKSKVTGFPRPLLDLSSKSFAKLMDNAFGKPLVPPFDPYANSLNFIIASYVIPYVGLTGYVGANRLLESATSRELVAGLLGVESGQDAILRELLYVRKEQLVSPYGVVVEEFTNRISILRSKLGNRGLKDEGIVVPFGLGAEGKVRGNILAGDVNSLAYSRTPEEILRIVYESGDEHVCGGFYPIGASVLPFILLDYSSSVLFASAKSPESKDADLLEFALNLEYLEAEFFLFGALGHGLDVVAPNLTGGGPLPIGAKKVELDDLTNDVILQFAFQEVGHLRAIKSKVTGFPRPLLDLSSKSFAKLMDNAFGKPLVPPFDPYANSLNFIIASYVIPYVGLTGYVGANRLLQSATSRELVAGLLGVESGQDAILRELLYERKEQLVPPYGVAVEEFTNRISILRSKLGKRGLKDEGIVVPFGLGAEGKVRGNILAGDVNSLAYSRTPEEILRIVYGSGDEHVCGGFYPIGASVLPFILLDYSSSVLFASAKSPESKDADLLEFALNLEYLEAEFFLFGALGHGLDVVAPNLTGGGPLPIGAKKVELDDLTNDVILQFAFQEVGHLRAIKSKVTGFPRPLLDLSSKSFAKLMDNAFGKPLVPPFDPYANSLNFIIASYVIPYVGLTGYVGANRLLQSATSRELVAGLLGVESGQDAILRELLYERKEQLVPPYGIAVEEFTNRISILRSKLGNKGLKDEGIVVPFGLGAEGKVRGNILAGDVNSLAYSRTPEEILRIVYGSGDEHLVHPYGLSVEVFTDGISMLRNKLGNKGLKDEGLIVPKVEGAKGNILAGDIDLLAYPRTPEEILRIIYGGGDEHFPGDFYSRGASGRIATSYLNFTT
ncbi:Desiccation-related protein PCC13-62 [Glycine soja]